MVYNKNLEFIADQYINDILYNFKYLFLIDHISITWPEVDNMYRYYYNYYDNKLLLKIFLKKKINGMDEFTIITDLGINLLDELNISTYELEKYIEDKYKDMKGWIINGK